MRTVEAGIGQRSFWVGLAMMNQHAGNCSHGSFAIHRKPSLATQLLLTKLQLCRDNLPSRQKVRNVDAVANLPKSRSTAIVRYISRALAEEFWAGQPSQATKAEVASRQVGQAKGDITMRHCDYVLYSVACKRGQCEELTEPMRSVKLKKSAGVDLAEYAILSTLDPIPMDLDCPLYRSGMVSLHLKNQQLFYALCDHYGNTLRKPADIDTWAAFIVSVIQEAWQT